MWNHFIGQPLAMRIVALVVALALGVYGWVRRKVVGAVLKAGNEWLKARGRKWLDVRTPTPPTLPSNLRTYKGIFKAYHHSAPTKWHLVIEDNDTITEVPVMKSDTLARLPLGAFVEIDTQTGIGLWEEVVLRTRIVKKPKSQGAAEI